jgi:hypothetical protein
MPRVTHVKKAQQRYATVPVIDPVTGEQKTTPVMKKVRDRETGEITEVQKTDKRGKAVVMRVTRQDKTKPKPNLRCDFPGCDIDDREIKPGSAYNWIKPKSGPYGGTLMARHAAHPTWQVWEYSSSWSARIAQATADFDVSAAESPDDVTSALEDVANAIRELAEESRETASNIEEGFGHATSQSEEAEQRADDLDGWADEIEQVDVPDLPEPETRYFVTNGDGVVSDLFEEDGYETEADAEHALAMHREDNGTTGDGDDSDDGFEVEAIEPDELTEEQLDEWRDEVESLVDIVNESPV